MVTDAIDSQVASLSESEKTEEVSEEKEGEGGRNLLTVRCP